MTIVRDTAGRSAQLIDDTLYDASGQHWVTLSRALLRGAATPAE